MKTFVYKLIISLLLDKFDKEIGDTTHTLIKDALAQEDEE